MTVLLIGNVPSKVEHAKTGTSRTARLARVKIALYSEIGHDPGPLRASSIVHRA